MAKFGSKDTSYRKERIVDSSSDVVVKKPTSTAYPAQAAAAHSAGANLYLAIEKNQVVIDAANDIATKEDLYIPVPGPTVVGASDLSRIVNRYLQNRYPDESSQGSKITFHLFKLLISKAIEKQNAILDKLKSAIDLGSDSVIDLSNLDLSSVLKAFSPDIPQAQSSGVGDGSAADDLLRKQLLSVFGAGIAIAAVTTLAQHEKVKAMFSGKDDIKEVAEEPAKDVAEAAAKKAKIARILIKISEAIILFALIHNLTREQVVQTATSVIPNNLDPEDRDRFLKDVQDLYDADKLDERKLLLLGLADDPADGDRAVFDYCVEYIEAHPEKDFSAWTVYMGARLKDIQLQDLALPLEEITPYAPRAIKSTVTSVTTTKAYMGRGNLNDAIQKTIQDELDRGNRKIEKYFPDDMHGPLKLNISDYVKVTDDSANNSLEDSNIFMSILKNNAWTPELICCLINFLIKSANFDKIKKFLKNLRALLLAGGSLVDISIGKALQDMINNLYTSLIKRLFSYIYARVTKFAEKIKGAVMDFAYELFDGPDAGKHGEFMKFCTPLPALILAILAAIDALVQYLMDIIGEFEKYLLGFQVTIRNFGIKAQGALHNKNLLNLIDSLLAALDIGKLCNKNANGIHPDAYDIIVNLSRQPDSELFARIENYNNLAADTAVFHPDRNDEGFKEDKFTDPIDPKLHGPVSIGRAPGFGESIVETIAKYQDQCRMFLGTPNSTVNLISPV